MDPNLFHLDWDRLAEVLAAIIVLAFLLERVLSLVFEHRLYLRHMRNSGAKEFIAFGLAACVCWYWDFDAISMILLSEQTTFPGAMITAGVIAGGSKGAVKLFRDIMGIKSAGFREDERAGPAAPSDPQAPNA